MNPPTPHTQASLHAEGRDLLGMLRADEALAVDPGWLARALVAGPVAFWGDDAGRASKAPYTVTNGVAVYPIDGFLMQRGGSYLQGYDSIRVDLQRALDDTAVQSILLRINSPGGFSAGCFEGVMQMRAAIEVSGKRVVAFADETASSAAYALACIADEIVLPEPGGVGSIGVLRPMTSWAAANKACGIDARLFTSGVEKVDGAPDLPISEGAATRAQDRVDQLAAIFHRWVASRRGMTPEAVRALEAGMRYGPDAVAAGLADRVASFPATVAALAATTAPIVLEKAMTEEEKNLLAFGRTALAMVGAKDPDEGAPSLAALRQRATQADQLEGEVTGLRTKLAAAEQSAEADARAKLIDDGHRSGRITKANLEDPEWCAMTASFSIGQLKTFVAKLTVQTPVGAPLRPAKTAKAHQVATAAAAVARTGGGAEIALTAEEIEAAGIARVPLDKARAAKAARLARVASAASSGAQVPGADDEDEDEEV